MLGDIDVYVLSRLLIYREWGTLWRTWSFSLQSYSLALSTEDATWCGIEPVFDSVRQRQDVMQTGGNNSITLSGALNMIELELTLNLTERSKLCYVTQKGVPLAAFLQPWARNASLHLMKVGQYS